MDVQGGESSSEEVMGEGICASEFRNRGTGTSY